MDSCEIYSQSLLYMITVRLSKSPMFFRAQQEPPERLVFRALVLASRLQHGADPEINPGNCTPNRPRDRRIF